MDEDIHMPACARARLIQQSCTVRFQTFHDRREIWDLDRHMVQTFAALLDEFCDYRIRARGFQQLNAWTAGRQHGDVHLFLLHGLAQANSEAKLLLIKAERVVQRSNGDAQVINLEFV